MPRGRILYLHFSETECTDGYLEALQAYLPRHGRPQAFYADSAAVFRSPSANKHMSTQFQRAVDKLGIALICADPAQAEGHVERVNRTLQDRLVKPMRLDGIKDINVPTGGSGNSSSGIASNSPVWCAASQTCMRPCIRPKT